MKIVAVVTDLADRMALGEGITFVRRAADVPDDAELVIVDLTVPGALDAVVAGRRTIAYGPHVASDLLALAEAAGAEALPRSRFFRDPRRFVDP
jgi:hypothetical protein